MEGKNKKFQKNKKEMSNFEFRYLGSWQLEYTVPPYPEVELSTAKMALRHL